MTEFNAKVCGVLGFVTLAFVDRRNQKMYNTYKKLMVLIGFLPVFCENS